MKCNVHTFKAMLNSTIFAVDEYHSRYSLGNVLVDFGERETHFVGTDGMRLAARSAKVEGNGFGESLLIPHKTAKELSERITQNATGNITVEPNEDGTASATWLGHNRKPKRVDFRPADGHFPIWRDTIWEGDPKAQWQGKASEILAALPDVDQNGWLFDATDGKSVHFRREHKVKHFTTYAGRPLGVLFDVSFLREWLETLPSDAAVTIAFRDDSSAIRCNASDGSTYVLMPMRKD